MCLLSMQRYYYFFNIFLFLVLFSSIFCDFLSFWHGRGKGVKLGVIALGLFLLFYWLFLKRNHSLVRIKAFRGTASMIVEQCNKQYSLYLLDILPLTFCCSFIGNRFSHYFSWLKSNQKVSASAKQVVATFAQEFPAEISFGRALLVALVFHLVFWAAR